MFSFGHHAGLFLWFYQWFNTIFDSGGMIKSAIETKFISIFYMCICSHTVFSFGSPYHEFKCTKNTFVFHSCLLQVFLSFTGPCCSHRWVQHGAFVNSALQILSYRVRTKVSSHRRWSERDQDVKEPFYGLTSEFLEGDSVVLYWARVCICVITFVSHQWTQSSFICLIHLQPSLVFCSLYHSLANSIMGDEFC